MSKIVSNCDKEITLAQKEIEMYVKDSCDSLSIIAIEDIRVSRCSLMKCDISYGEKWFNNLESLGIITPIKNKIHQENINNPNNVMLDYGKYGAIQIWQICPKTYSDITTRRIFNMTNYQYHIPFYFAKVLNFTEFHLQHMDWNLNHDGAKNIRIVNNNKEMCIETRIIYNLIGSSILTIFLVSIFMY